MGWPDVSWRFHGMKRASGEDAVLQASPIASETNLSADEKATKVVWVIADAPGAKIGAGNVEIQ